MKSTIYSAILAGLLVASSGCKGQAQQTVVKDPEIRTIAKPVIYRFASNQEAGNILTAKDAHFNNMQKTEMGVRLENVNDPTLEKLSAQYRDGLVAWSEEEKAFLLKVVEKTRPALSSMRKHLPDEVLFAKISTDIEGGLPHTRANLILFSDDFIQTFIQRKKTDPARAEKELTKLFLHELHHVLTRANQDKMDDYFAIIGFEPCQFTEPSELRKKRLTNPDAPEYHHYAPIEVDGTNGLIPYLKVTGPYDKAVGGNLGSHMDFSLLRVSVSDGTCTVTDQSPQSIAPVPAFLDLIGQNTGYIIHPEETLADNFVHYVMKSDNLPNPEIPEAVGVFWTR